MIKLISLFVMMFLLTLTGQSNSTLPNGEGDQDNLEVSSISREALITFARQFLGTPYHYASSSPTKGFDCSGFVNFVFRNFKVALPRSSTEFKNMGRSLKPEEFKAGDVIVFKSFKNKARIGHVGIICEADGMHSKFIHSSSGHKMGVVVSDLGSPNYSKRFYRCVDVLAGK